MSDIEGVLSFWFSPEPQTPEQLEERQRFWFRGGPAVDEEIGERFGNAVSDARAGKLDGWAETPRGALALIILLDQFPRNLFRGSADAFASDDKALALARAGWDAGRFDALGLFERQFAALPFEHAEDLEAQKRAVALFVHAAIDCPPLLKASAVMAVDFARKHLDVIARFGRFPHRNAALGRLSTAAEDEYLTYLKSAGQWL